MWTLLHLCSKLPTFSSPSHFVTQRLRRRSRRVASQNTVSRSAWSLRRHSLHHELAREPAWRQFEVWDALLRHSHLTSLQGRQQRRLCGLTHASDRNSDDSPGIAMSILQSLVLPMVSMHLPFDDIATFIVRSCALYAISQGDEHALLGMLRALFSAEDDAAVGGLPALPPTFTTYEPFAAGQASSTSATAARSKSAVASVVPATASATRTGSLSSPPASTRALPIESASELLSGSHTRSVPRILLLHQPRILAVQPALHRVILTCNRCLRRRPLQLLLQLPHLR